MPAGSVTIFASFPNEYEKVILSQVCERRQGNVVHVAQLARFGYSGAKLLLIYFNNAPLGVPFILKVAPNKDIEREYNAVIQMRNWVQDCDLVDDHIYKSGKWAALLYEHRGTDQPSSRAENPRSFREFLFCSDQKFSRKRLLSTLEEVYAKLAAAQSEKWLKDVVIRDHYERYFREDRTARILNAILGRDRAKESFGFLSTEIYNPLHFFREMPHTVPIHVSRVHGDLHPDNIILFRDSTPKLIDFAWAAKRDILLDFVLLENSIRFKDFPRAANLDDQLEVDRNLLQENGWQPIADKSFSSDEATQIYRRLGLMVGMIRQIARRRLGDSFSMSRYLLSQFIVLYGLMRFDSYPRYVTTRALGMIAKELKAQKETKSGAP